MSLNRRVYNAMVTMITTVRDYAKDCEERGIDWPLADPEVARLFGVAVDNPTPENADAAIAAIETAIEEAEAD